MKVSDKTLDYLWWFIQYNYDHWPSLVEFFNNFFTTKDDYRLYKRKHWQSFPSKHIYIKEKLEQLNWTKELEKVFIDIYWPINYIWKSDAYKNYIKIINQYLHFDDYKLEVWNKSIKVITITDDKTIELEKKNLLNREYSSSQLIKIKEKFEKWDFDWAIANCFSLIQTVFDEMYQKLKWESIWKAGSLKDDYNKIKKELNLEIDKTSSNEIKKILSWFISIIDWIDNLCNDMWERHRRPIKPQKHHAKLIINSSITLLDFLYDTIEYQWLNK